MILSETTARSLINLNPYNDIDNEIAERQFQVILKGFNFLMQDESNILYIADEVGLGKTYVALGIASLLRHFSSPDRRGVYKDLILVPKRNLQYKWIKEINNFIRHNYLIECNIVKSVLGTPVGKCNDSNIHHKLDIFNANNPSYEVFRNTSFSIATTEGYDWKSKLENELPEDLKPFFQKARKLFTRESDIYLKRLFAFLLNIALPKVDLLIVDEAHNFKHGVGNEVSYRNQVVSRLMGVMLPEDDEYIFNYFPELKSRIIQKAKKVIFLSATPIDNGLYELKHQLDCFFPSHKFKNSENIEEEIGKQLNTFMIRGLMKIKLEHEGEVSRNMYRHEHRRGNVEKIFDADPQYIKDDLDSIIIGLLQLKTLKHFNESNNRSFEIGMLAGFETFKTQNNEEPEFEDSTDSKNKAVDHDVIKKIAHSYFDTFDKHLPHPKQDNLIRVLFEGVKRSQKALVFVRRIASVNELERKLTAEIENWHFSKIEKYINKSNGLKQLKTAFNERHQILEIEEVLNDLSFRVYEYFKRDFDFFIEDADTDVLQLIRDYLIVIYNSEDSTLDLIEFRTQVKEHIRLKIIKSDLRNLSKKLIENYLKNKEESEDLEEEEQGLNLIEDFFGYFFSTYFGSKRYSEGFNFRKRALTKDWYRFNIFHLKNQINNLKFDTSKLVSINFSDKEKTEAKRMDIINERLIEALTIEDAENIDNIIDKYFKKKTFFNVLLENVLNKEFDKWILRKWSMSISRVDFLNDLNALIEIFQGVFRNGSGLLPAYIAESISKDNFEIELINILRNSFPEVIKELRQIIEDFDKIMATNFSNRGQIQRALYGQYPIVGVSGSHKRDVSRVATQFRMPGFPYVLFTTDVLKEGEDLHLYCKDVYHYGIAWNPSDMEQRTGRIDRINSSCYFQLKADGKRSFDNSLQVFYPYLADTLEVNQVAKVFHKMNDFIETFYDITKVGEKDTKAEIDEIVKEIPIQIKANISSKYDFDTFVGLNHKFKSELEVNKNVGYNGAYLSAILNRTLKILENNFEEFFNKPILDNRHFLIHTSINLNNRRAPLRISLIKGDSFDEILFSIESIICRNTELRSRRSREEIKLLLNKNSLNLIEYNNLLLVQKRLSLETEANKLLTIIGKVIQIADYIEDKYIGGDLEV